MVTSFTDIELTGRRNTTFDNAEGTCSTARGWEIDVRLPIFDWGGMQRDAMGAADAARSQPARIPACALCRFQPAESYSALSTLTHDVACVTTAMKSCCASRSRKTSFATTAC